MLLFIFRLTIGVEFESGQHRVILEMLKMFPMIFQVHNTNRKSRGNALTPKLLQLLKLELPDIGCTIKELVVCRMFDGIIMQYLARFG